MDRGGVATRARIVAAAYRLFYREGFARTRMSAIAAAAGVTKRTLYHHFDSKDALLGAVLAAPEDAAQALIGEWRGTEEAATAEELVAVLFRGLAAWAATPRWHGSGYSRLAMELADMPGHPALRLARLHKAEVEGWLARALAARGAEAPEALAREMLLLIEGAMCLALIHGDPAYFAAAGRAAAGRVGDARRTDALGANNVDTESRWKTSEF